MVKVRWKERGGVDVFRCERVWEQQRDAGVWYLELVVAVYMHIYNGEYLIARTLAVFARWYCRSWSRVAFWAPPLSMTVGKKNARALLVRPGFAPKKYGVRW